MLPFDPINKIGSLRVDFSGSNRIVQCAFCRIAIYDVVRGYPSIIHKKLSTDCPYSLEERYDAERSFCCVCLIKSHQVLYRPCNNLTVCAECDQTSFSIDNSCPICRSEISRRIYVIKP